ncbi:MAG TPA: hypothetical protein VNA24_06660 [Hyalangium sp.]|nr:hypothetical protein [Hyalangium sp.]
MLDACNHWLPLLFISITIRRFLDQCRPRGDQHLRGYEDHQLDGTVQVTALKPGSAIITVSADEASGEAALEVGGMAIDAIERQPQLAGDDLGRHGLARTTVASEQRRDAKPPIHAAGELPLSIDSAAAGHLPHDLAQQPLRLGGDHQVIPRRAHIDPLCQRVEPGARAVPAVIPQALGQCLERLRRCLGHGPADIRAVEAELPGQPARGRLASLL